MSQENQKPQDAQSLVPTEIQIIQAESAARFALTPIGQQVKQFEVQQRMARMYSTSSIVPKAYQGDANLGSCVIAIDMAMRMQASPLMVMQNLYVVNGNPSFSSKFLIATINASGRFSPLRFEFRGEEGKPNYACRAYAYEAGDRERKEKLFGDWVSIDMANKEGWSKKPGSKWLTMPNQMLRYRAAAFWQRVYCPEISMGLMTTEEYEDINQSKASAENEIRIEANKGGVIDITPDANATETPAEQEQAPAKKVEKTKDASAPKPQPAPQPEPPQGEDDDMPDFMR